MDMRIHDEQVVVPTQSPNFALTEQSPCRTSLMWLLVYVYLLSLFDSHHHLASSSDVGLIEADVADVDSSTLVELFESFCQHPYWHLVVQPF
jgi:hypothetical protein